MMYNRLIQLVGIVFMSVPVYFVNYTSSWSFEPFHKVINLFQSLLALETKCDTIPEAASLAPLRLLLQRALDIALTAMLSLCQHQHQHLMHHS